MFGQIGLYFRAGVRRSRLKREWIVYFRKGGNFHVWKWDLSENIYRKILTKSSSRDCKMPLAIGPGFAEVGSCT